MLELVSARLDLEAAPLLTSATARQFGPTLIVAPHPDDETLGCGGLLALLSDAGQAVRVLVMSDGTLSHPNSSSYPAPRLQALRESETLAGLAKLGIASDAVTFWAYRDRSVPGHHSAGFAEAIARFQNYVSEFEPATICVPWRRDPHPDHRATTQIVRSATMAMPRPRLLEYLIWTWELAQDSDYPTQSEVRAWRLDINAVLARKRAAINCYRSQISDLIDDDPDGFRLSAQVLAHFERPWELFLENVSNE